MNPRKNAIGIINENATNATIKEYSQKIYKEAFSKFIMAEAIPTETDFAKEETEKQEGKNDEENPIISSPSPLELARQLNEDNKKLLNQITEERKKIEKASAEMMISGRSYMSPKPKEKTEEEKWAERARQRYKGTGMDPTI